MAQMVALVTTDLQDLSQRAVSSFTSPHYLKTDLIQDVHESGRKLATSKHLVTSKHPDFMIPG